MSAKLFEQALSAVESGDLFEAEKKLRQARGIFSQSEDLAKVHFMLGMILERQQRLDESMDSLKACFELREQILGLNDPATALTLKIWAAVATRLPDQDVLACELNKQSVAVAVGILGEEHAETVSARMKYAAVLIRSGQFDTAFEELLICGKNVHALPDFEDQESVLDSLEKLIPKVLRSDATLLVGQLRSSLIQG